jgi:hypothetical protein
MYVAHQPPLEVRPIDSRIVEYQLAITRHFIPHLRVIRATSGLHGRPYLVLAMRGVLVYDANATPELRCAYLSSAIGELWRQRHLAGLGDYEHAAHRHLSAVS